MRRTTLGMWCLWSANVVTALLLIMLIAVILKLQAVALQQSMVAFKAGYFPFTGWEIRYLP
jgi:hypothetical protein